MLKVPDKRKLGQLLRAASALHQRASSYAACSLHGTKCCCCQQWMAMPHTRGLPQQFSRGFATEDDSREQHQLVPSPSRAIHNEADEAMRKLPRIRPPTRDAIGSEQLPIASAQPPPAPKSDTVVRRLLGQPGVALSRSLESATARGSVGKAFSEQLKNLRLQGLNIDESWDGLLTRWDAMLDDKKYATVLGEMQEKGGRENELLTTLYRDIARRQEADQRAIRHAKVEESRAMIAASRVVTLDEQGRAYGTGKRKTSIARVWIRDCDGKVRINGRHFDDYIKPWAYREEIFKPFEVTGTLGQFDVVANVHGGGVSGQASAIRHGISKALQCYNPELRDFLRPAGLLTRDARVVERKKPGKAKARKSFQWVKR